VSCRINILIRETLIIKKKYGKLEVFCNLLGWDRNLDETFQDQTTGGL
jgi:hypothetical protein